MIAPPFQRRAWTLTEVLVVVALLGILAGTLAPALGVFLRRADSTQVSELLKQSWELARAHAQASGQPVLWQMQAHPDSATISLRSPSGDLLWQRQVVAENLAVEEPPPSSGDLRLLVYPHGLLAPVTLRWQIAGQSDSCVLPPDLPSWPAGGG